jgi:hypothetical protein
MIKALRSCLLRRTAKKPAHTPAPRPNSDTLKSLQVNAAIFCLVQNAIPIEGMVTPESGR